MIHTDHSLPSLSNFEKVKNDHIQRKQTKTRNRLLNHKAIDPGFFCRGVL